MNSNAPQRWSLFRKANHKLYLLPSIYICGWYCYKKVINFAAICWGPFCYDPEVAKVSNIFLDRSFQCFLNWSRDYPVMRKDLQYPPRCCWVYSGWKYFWMSCWKSFTARKIIYFKMNLFLFCISIYSQIIYFFHFI